MMSKKTLLTSIFSLALSATSFAASKTYQVTGPVLESTADTITVQKGKEKWEITRDPSTKVSGDVKVGDKVTIEYRMTATSIDVKSAGGGKAAKKPKAR